MSTKSKSPAAINAQAIEAPVIKGEPVERALKRLKIKLEAEGILDEVRRLRAFETPKEKLRRKARAAAKRGKIRFRFTMNRPACGEKASAVIEAKAAAPEGAEDRWYALVQKKIARTATSAELEEYIAMRDALREERKRVAPLPIKELKAIHQQLLDQGSEATAG